MNILPGEYKLGPVSRRIRLRGSRSHGHAWRLKCRHHRCWQILHGYVQASELRNGHVNHTIIRIRTRD